MRSNRYVLAILLILTLGRSPAVGQPAPIVAAASHLTFALKEVANRFERDHEQRVELVFGSSGNLTRQIIDGAPFEAFFSADETLVDRLADAGLTRDRGTLYASGRLVLFAPHGSPLAVDEQLDGLRVLLAGGGVTRFAIANPEHAPYGRAAEAFLRKNGVWEALQPALILGTNVSQAARFATTGNAVGGIVAYSLVLAAPLRSEGSFVLLSEADHPALRQRMVLLKRAGPTAERFYQYLQGHAARDILRRYGFQPPKP